MKACIRSLVEKVGNWFINKLLIATTQVRGSHKDVVAYWAEPLGMQVFPNRGSNRMQSAALDNPFNASALSGEPTHRAQEIKYLNQVTNIHLQELLSSTDTDLL